MEVGNLSIPIRADLGPLQRDLDKLRGQLGQAENQTRGVNSAMRGMESQTKGLTAALRPFAAALAGAFSVRALINFADTWSDISSRVGIAVGNFEIVPQVMERIAATARMTYSNLNLTAEGFVRNSMVLKELGLSTQQQLNYQEALNNALVVSGARGRAAEFVQESLNRSMALGAMRGIELNNVLNYGGRIAELLAEHFGTTTGGLMNLAREGKITADVIQNVLTKNMVTLRDEAESMPATIGDAFTLLGNSLLQVIGSFDQASSISETFAEALIFVADNMQRVISVVATGTAGWAAYRVAIIAVNAGLFTAAGALAAVQAALRRLLISSGIGILVVAVGELVNIIWDARSASDSWSDAWQRLGTFFTSVTYAMRTAFSGFVLAADGMWKRFVADFLATASQAAGVFGVLFDVADQIAGLEGASRQSLTGAAIRFGDAATALQDAYKKLREGAAGADLSGDGGPNRVVADPGKEKKSKAQRDAERLAEAYADLIRDSQAFIEMQSIEQQAIGMTELEAAKLRATFDLLNQAQRAGINLTAAQTEELTNLAHQMAEAEYATDKLRESYEFNKDVFKGFFTDLRSELQNGASIWEAFGNAAANALQKIADKALDMALNGIFDMIFGAFGGAGGGGGFLGGILGFANGTSFAPGGWSVVGEQGPELIKMPAGSQVVPNHRVTAPRQASFGGGGGMQDSRVAVDIFVKDDGKIGAIARQEAGAVVETTIREYDTHTLPSSVQRVSEKPRMR